jgi:Ni/Fe-hydrogenase 1 B-type cytochrome subunit
VATRVGVRRGRHARWRELLPAGRAYRAALRRYVSALRAGKHPQYLGHNPLGRISVFLLLVLLTTQAVTGLILARSELPPAFVVRAHDSAFFALLVLTAIHIGAVVVSEVRGGGNLVSAMFTGRKILRAPLAARGPDPGLSANGHDPHP